MLPKINRLRNAKDIGLVFKKGQGLKEGHLFLKSAKNGLGVIRFAFIVSQKVSKKASSRNRIKRGLREAVRALLPRAKTGLDAVIIVQKDAEGKNFQEIKNNTERLFKKAKIL